MVQMAPRVAASLGGWASAPHGTAYVVLRGSRQTSEGYYERYDLVRMDDTRMSATTTELPHRILLVDDDVDERDALACFLEMEGMDVSTAGGGQEALDALGTGPLHCVIVLDLNMAGMDGWEFRRRQLLMPQMASIPVVVLSGHPDLKTVTRTMQAREVCAKPVAPDVLLHAVCRHCSLH